MMVAAIPADSLQSLFQSTAFRKFIFGTCSACLIIIVVTVVVIALAGVLNSSKGSDGINTDNTTAPVGTTTTENNRMVIPDCINSEHALRNAILLSKQYRQEGITLVGQICVGRGNPWTLTQILIMPLLQIQRMTHHTR